MVGGREGTRLQARIADTGRPLETDTKVNGSLTDEVSKDRMLLKCEQQGMHLFKKIAKLMAKKR